MTHLKYLVLFIFTLLTLLINISNGFITMTQKLENDRNLSHFTAQIQKNRLSKSALSNREVTFLAPTYGAFEKFDGKLTEDLILYHMVPVARTLDNLNSGHLDTFLEEAPPLWVNTKNDDIFINNAKIIKNSSDTVLKTRPGIYGRLQILHIIDEVLTPMALTTSIPSAYDFLSQQKLWDQISYTSNNFYKKIISHRKDYLYKNNENTYFIPVDQYMDQSTISVIDKEVIDRNVIANRVIFTRVAMEEFAYVTRGVDKFSFNTIEFMEIGGDFYVKTSSISKMTNQKIHEKIVLILTPNIPCKNGVIHLVKEVLGVYKKKLTKFPYLPVLAKIENDPNLNISSYLIDKTGLRELIELESCNFTIFIPNDSAWRQIALENNLDLNDLDSPKFLARAKKILERHVIGKEIWSLHRLLEASQNLRHSRIVLDVICADQMLIKVVEQKGRYYIHWGTQVIRILRPDYECSNGLVHVIDRPFVFASDFAGIKPKSEYSTLLYDAWALLKHSVL